jgi:hypothetical protein
MIRTIMFFVFLSVFSLTIPAFGEDLESRLQALEKTIQQQGKMIEEQQRTIESLKEKAARGTVGVLGEEVTTHAAVEPSAPVRDYRRDDRTRGVSMQSTSPVIPYQTLQGQPSLMNPSISLILDTLYYSSDRSQAELESRSIPGFVGIPDEGFRKGFNLRSAELSFFAPVDPYFSLYATIPFEEEGVELEEAYFVTTSLPYALQLKGGKFKSGFGRINSQHPHAWDFVDIPLVYRGFLGGEGLIEKGAQITLLPDLPFYMLIGGEVLQGDNEVLFGPDAHPGPHAFAAFVKASLDLSDNSTILFGPSVVTGKTKTDSIAEDTEFSGTSTLYNLEFTYKWRPSNKQGFILQSEYFYRRQTGDLEDLALEAEDSLKRTQDGLYVQGVYQLDRWRLGGRYDALDLFKDKYRLSGSQQGFGRKPWRASGMLEYNPSEFSRIRLQYNHDRSDRSGRANNEVMLQVILGIGAHGAHTF